MPKILVLHGDSPIHEMQFEDDNFIFIITAKAIFHIDLTDGNMWRAKADLSNLGDGHKKVITGLA